MSDTSRPYRLRLPGPTPLPERVRTALSQPMVGHRCPEFVEVLADAAELAKPLFGTVNPVMTFSSSGTGLMEAAAANVLSRGDRALMLVNGMFSSRFADIVAALGYEADVIQVPWGQTVSAEAVGEKLKGAVYGAVFAVHNETSTGAVTDIEAIGKVVGETNAVFVVDSISGLGGIAIEQDAWGVDVLITASQKALMCPPGLALASVSDKAWKVIDEEGGKARFYFDFRKARAFAADDQTAFTSSVSLTYALREALRMIHEEGWENVLDRHRRLASALRKGCAALGLPVFASSPIVSDTVGVFLVPEGLDGKAATKHLYETFGAVIVCTKTDAGARVFRIGTMGHCNDEDIATDLEQIAQTLEYLNWKAEAAQ
jgi:aspartate aminotransferase-like enzyme